MAWIGWAMDGFRGMVEVVCILAALLVCILLHEFAHIGVAALFGSRTRRVLLIPFGCIADLESIPREPYEIWMALAGPCTSLALAGIAWIIHGLMGESETSIAFGLGSVLQIVAMFNLSVGCFNLLPCFPMDGGRVLRSVLALLVGLMRGRSAYSARILATRIAVRYIAWPLVVSALCMTIFWTHCWPHLIMFGLLLLGAEAEYWHLRESPEALDSPMMVTFEPMGLDDDIRDPARPEPRALLKRFEVVVVPSRAADVMA
jgi:Zn-dependent protease